MRVSIELQAYLDQYAPDSNPAFDMELPEGSKVLDIVKKLGVPGELASVVIVSNTSVDHQHVLRDGDTVTLIPPLAGG